MYKQSQEEQKQLKQQLAEKDELLKQKIGDMKSTDFIKMCIKSGFMMEAKENDNQTAIAELEKLKKEMFEGKCQMWLDIATNEYVINHRDKSIIDYIDKRINELRGGK